MCWNKEISILTFVLAVIGVIYLYNRDAPNDRWIALFGLTIAMIQLAEYFMWNENSCNNINKYASIFALLILALEPLSNMIGGIYFGDISTGRKTVLRWMLVAYLLFIGYVYFSQVYQKNVNFCGTSPCQINGNTIDGYKGCNLKWYFMDSFGPKTAIIWILFLLIPFLTMTPAYQGVILFIIGVGTFFISRKTNIAATGSIWCWLAILAIYVKIFMR